MEVLNKQIRWQQVRGKKPAYWGILTLDDLPNTNLKYNQLIAQYKNQFRADKKQREKLNPQKSEDFPISGSTR